ncbi:MAG: hypothetical protein K0R17_310 [Rariglobus sp.]|jgi:hypothetical protein|nr:hypothetical protein [Rariglobus sp.]
MAKSTPLEKLKDEAGLPDNKWGKLLGATPVIMTVIATLLAGLASSEMTKAQYERAYAAQLQSRAGDQWAFFQAKRLRGEMQRNTLDLLMAQAGAGAPAAEDAPPPPPAPEIAPELAVVLQAMRDDAPDETLAPLLLRLPPAMLAGAQRVAKDHAAGYDAITRPLLEKIEAGGSVAGRLRFNTTRYDHEAQLNAAIARLYEVQVRKTNFQAQRHHTRSQRFFFGMLAAQMGVIISTLAMAAKKRNLLWSLAAGAGLVAIVFAIYVYLYV